MLRCPKKWIFSATIQNFCAEKGLYVLGRRIPIVIICPIVSHIFSYSFTSFPDGKLSFLLFQHEPLLKDKLKAETSMDISECGDGKITIRELVLKDAKSKNEIGTLTVRGLFALTGSTKSPMLIGASSSSNNLLGSSDEDKPIVVARIKKGDFRDKYKVTKVLGT
jgi:hypothetical protein